MSNKQLKDMEHLTQNSEISQTDPAWDYYPVWHSCQHIKAKIDTALKIMSQSENATAELDKEIHDLLDLASDKLIDIINDLEHDDD